MELLLLSLFLGERGLSGRIGFNMHTLEKVWTVSEFNSRHRGNVMSLQKIKYD
jgi:hypothetical protein